MVEIHISAEQLNASDIAEKFWESCAFYLVVDNITDKESWGG